MDAPASTPPTISELPPEISLPGRLANIFAAPGEVFESVAPRPFAAANWLVPALLLLIAGWAAAWFVFSQPNIQQELKEITRSTLEKQFAKQKLPPEKVEEVMRQAEKYGAIGIHVTTYAKPVIQGLITPLIWGLILWGLGKAVFKTEFPFMKGVEVVGLGAMIEVLNTVVSALLAMAKGTMFATPSLALLVKDFDPQNALHGGLSALNLMGLWALAVYAVGLSKLVRVSFARAAAWVFGVWFVYTGLLIGMGVLAQKLTAK